MGRQVVDTVLTSCRACPTYIWCGCARCTGSDSRVSRHRPLPPRPFASRSPHSRAGPLLPEMVMLRATAPARAAFRAANVLRSSSTAAPYNPPSPYSGVSFQPHPHSLPVDGFVGAVGNTPLVRQGSSSSRIIDLAANQPALDRSNTDPHQLAFRRDGLRGSGKGRVHEPGRVSQGPSGVGTCQVGGEHGCVLSPVVQWGLSSLCSIRGTYINIAYARTDQAWRNYC